MFSKYPTFEEMFWSRGGVGVGNPLKPPGYAADTNKIEIHVLHAQFEMSSKSEVKLYLVSVQKRVDPV